MSSLEEQSLSDSFYAKFARDLVEYVGDVPEIVERQTSSVLMTSDSGLGRVNIIEKRTSRHDPMILRQVCPQGMVETEHVYG